MGIPSSLSFKDIGRRRQHAQLRAQNQGAKVENQPQDGMSLPPELKPTVCEDVRKTRCYGSEFAVFVWLVN